jgi:hypothetical protein
MDRVHVPSAYERYRGGSRLRGALASSFVRDPTVWDNGTTVLVWFYDDDARHADAVWETVRRSLRERPSLGIHLRRAPTEALAHVRVAFDPTDGNWSTIGKDATQKRAGTPTMNLANVDERTVLHEFGHALGLRHMHQHRRSGIRWADVRTLATYFGWSEAQVRSNILATHEPTYAYTADSVMHYKVEPWYTQGRCCGRPTPPTNLSAADVAHLRAMYPPLAGDEEREEEEDEDDYPLHPFDPRLHMEFVSAFSLVCFAVLFVLLVSWVERRSVRKKKTSA